MSTNETIERDSRPIFVQSATYIAESLPILFLNGLIVCSVFKYEPLRRRNFCLIMAFLAANDACASLGFAVTGMRRIYLISTGQLHVLVTKWHCLWTSAVIFLFPIQTIYGFVQAAIGIDRLLAVYTPLRHGGFGTKYVWILMVIAHVPGLFAFTVLIFLLEKTRFEPPDISILCLPHDYFPGTYYKIVNIQGVATLSLCCILYTIVWRKYSIKNKVFLETTKFIYKKNQKNPKNKAAIKYQLKQQRRLTVSLLIRCCVTFWFLVLPICTQMVLVSLEKDDILTYFLPFRGFLAQIHLLLTFCIFTRRHKEMNKAVKYFLKCKELSETAVVNAANE